MKEVLSVYYASSFYACALIAHRGDRVRAFLERNGHALVADPDKADAIVLNTCAFDEVRESKAVAMIEREIEKYGRGKRIIVCGCLPKIGARLAERFPGLDFIGPQEMRRFDEIFSARVPYEQVSVHTASRTLAGPRRQDEWDAGRYYIQIGTGCASRCTYCAVKRAGGNPRSRPAEELLLELRRGLAAGFKRFILIGNDCGSYGLDLGTDFAELLNAMASVAGDWTIEIQSFEPHRLEVLFPKIRRETLRRIASVEIDLQSLSPRILGLMGRDYDIDNVFRIISEIKSASPGTSVGTHLLVCFPSETRREFTANFTHPSLRQLDWIMPFVYTPRERTLAAALPGRIDEKEKAVRLRWLKALMRRDQRVRFVSDGPRDDSRPGEGRDHDPMARRCAGQAPAGPQEGGLERYEFYRELTRLLARKGGWRFVLSDLGYMFMGRGPALEAAEIQERWRGHLERARRRGESPEINLYISMPYCRARCHYCNINPSVPRGAAELEGYSRRLCAEIRYFSGLFNGMSFAHAFMGGGSPTFFSERQLREICGALSRNLRFRSEGERTVEAHPANATLEKLRILREGKFNGLSLGAQSLDAGVLRRAGRGGQTPEMVAEAVSRARSAGFERVNLDLMVGLAPDDGEAFFDSFKALSLMGPDTITAYLCEPTAPYLKNQWKGDLGAFEANLAGQRVWLEKCAVWARANGFDEAQLSLAGGITFEKRDNPRASRGKGRYSCDILNPLQWLFSLGPNGRSYVYDAVDRRLQYEGLPLQDDPARNRFQTWELSPRDERRLFVLDCFARGGAASASEYRRLFNTELGEDFGAGLSSLKEMGLAAWDEAGAKLDRGLPWDERFAAGMFLFDHRWLVERLNGILGVAPISLAIDGRRHDLRLGYDPSSRGGFALETGAAEHPLDRKILEACRRRFETLAAAAQTRDAFLFREIYAARLKTLLEGLAAKLNGPRISCGL